MSRAVLSRVTGTLDVHGTRVSFDCDPALMSALEDVLLRYPLATRTEGPGLTFRVDHRRPERCAAPRTFFYGALDGSVTNGAYTLSSDDARIELDLSARTIQAAATNDSLELRTGALVALSLALRLDGRFHLHAAAATTAAGTRVLLVGDSGSGKTTTLLGLVAAGARPTADDVVFLQQRATGVRVLGHPRTYHLTPETLARFPELAHARVDGLAVPPKVAIDPLLVSDLTNLATLEEVDVIAFVRVAGSKTVVRPVPASEAFSALLTQSAFGALPEAPRVREQLDLLAALVQRSRCVELLLAEDALGDPSLLPRLLDDARGA